jgi:YVTN family beta-propeller protein
MNMSSVEEDFTLTWTEEGTTNTVDGSFSWRDYNKMVTFTPSGYLKEGTEYTISVSDAVMDLSANTMESSRSLTFTTVAVAPPEILYIGPGDEETGVTINTPIVVDFSEPINTSSVNSTTFKLLSGLNPSSSADPIDGTYEFFNENSTVVFRPLANLTEFTDYTIILTDGITDVSQPSSSLVANSETTFKTADKVSEPSISYLDLTYGVAGNAVTIAGAGFDPNSGLNTVRFNGTQAVITKAYLTSLEVVVPAEALSGPVTVTVNNITSNSRNFDIYTEILDPAGYATANAPIGKKSTHDSDVTPEGAFAYVTNPEEGTVSVVDMNTLDVETIMIGEGKYPLMIDINPEGTKAYVTNFYSSDVSVIDLVPGVNYNTVIKNISVGIGPWGVAVTPDGQRVYVANYYSGSLSMIDADPTSGGYDHATANIPIGKDPTVTKANPDGALVLVVGDFGLTIVNSDPSNKDEYNTATVNITIGKKFTEATSTPDGAFAIVSTDDGYLLLIDLYPESGDYSDAVVANVKTGSDPSDINARGDNAYVYLTDTDGDRILVYKIGAGGTGGSGSSMPSGIGMTLVYETEIPVGDAPQSLVIDADRLYVVDGDPSEPEIRRVTVIQFGLMSLSNGFSDLTKAIQGMIDAGYIKPANGKNIIRKLEEAQKYLDAGKTKNALNSLNAAGNMIKALMNSRQITVDQGNYLLNMLNLIIAEIIKDAKSDELDNYFFDLEQPEGELIAETKLGVIYPNPTREAITITYEIAENELGSEKVTIQIYDVIGRLVSNLVNENLAPGHYTATWNGYYDNGEMVTLGYYFIRFSAGNVREVKQIMMIR